MPTTPIHLRSNPDANTNALCLAKLMSSVDARPPLWETWRSRAGHALADWSPRTSLEAIELGVRVAGALRMENTRWDHDRIARRTIARRQAWAVLELALISAGGPG